MSRQRRTVWCRSRVRCPVGAVVVAAVPVRRWVEWCPPLARLPKAQVTQPSGVAQSGSVLSGAVDAGKKLATIVQQPSAASSGQTARQELREKQKAEIDAENAKKTEEAVKREEADKSLTNGGQSPTATTTAVKTESSLNTTKPTVSKEDYDKAQAKLQSDRSKGGIGSLSDKLSA